MESTRDNNATPFPPLLPEKQWRRAVTHFAWTRREGQIAWCLCCGMGYVAIRRRLGIEHSTLRTHLKSLYRKAACRGRVALILTLVHRKRKKALLPLRGD